MTDPIDATKLSEHFTLKEFLHSEKAKDLGIENFADHETIKNGYKTAFYLEAIRILLNHPMDINSWFRCLLVNRAVGSKDTSQHLHGEAVDFVCPGFGTPLEICKLLAAHMKVLQIDQLILEHSWVHVSFAIRSGTPKGQVLSLLATGGYAVGLTDKQGIPYR